MWYNENSANRNIRKHKYISEEGVSENTFDDTNALLPEINFMLEYDNAMLKYDHEITQAMNFIDNLKTNSSSF